MRKLASLITGATALAALAPFAASAAELPTCTQLGADPAYGLAGNPEISGLTVASVPAGKGVTVPYCRVDFTFSGESGPAAGYRPGQKEEIKIRVGLPLSAADGGGGGLQGAWNGNTRDLGGGGFAGTVGSVTSSTNLGYVGTSTDTGHDAAVQPGGIFGINPDNTLNWGQIRDFARDGIRQQYLWGVRLSKTYYGSDPVRKYWMGCSTGGRQGHYQAQNFPTAYDGILAGSPAFNWDRFVPAELWPQVVMNEAFGAPIPPAKLTAVTKAAVSACDAIDGVTDGILEDPRKCKYDAKAFVCTGNAGDPANCLTPEEATAVNKIWDGPRTSPGPGGWNNGSGRAWYGPARGANLTAQLAGATPRSTSVDYFRYWVMQDPAFDWKTATEVSFISDYLLKSMEKFNEVIGTDDGLEEFRRAGGKLITYHGLADELIMPRGTYNYYNNVKGGLERTQQFYRFFPYPNAGHCSGAGLNAEDLFSSLVNWVENGVAPEYLVAQVSSSRTRKICKYPDVQVYNGSGSIDDQSNFTCQVRNKDDKELLDQDELDRTFETRNER
jgi:hypothetical protein